MARVKESDGFFFIRLFFHCAIETKSSETISLESELGEEPFVFAGLVSKIEHNKLILF